MGRRDRTIQQNNANRRKSYLWRSPFGRAKPSESEARHKALKITEVNLTYACRLSIFKKMLTKGWSTEVGNSWKFHLRVYGLQVKRDVCPHLCSSKN